MLIHTSFCVAGPGIAPGLEDYEPSVRLYTTPHVVNEPAYYTTEMVKLKLFEAG